MQFRICLLALTLTPLFAQQPLTPIQLAARTLQEATSTQDSALKLQKLDEAYREYQEVLRLDARNRDAYYLLGVIDWMKCHPALEAAHDELKDAAVRRNLRQKYGPIINDGILNLNKALKIDSKSDGVSAYLAVLIWHKDELFNPKRVLHRAPPPPPPVERPATPQRIRVGSAVQSYGKSSKDDPIRTPLSKIDPVYPPLALQARVEGTVRFSAIIDKEGHVSNVQPISGHPLLVQAALDAVRQWVYSPTLLNGEPIEVVTPIVVSFKLPDAK